MSDESKHKIEDYLQFTPLASAVSIRPLIGSFVAPEVVVALPHHDSQTNAIDVNTTQDHVLSNILRKARQSRGSLSFRDLSLHVSSSDRPGKLSPRLQAILEQLRASVVSQTPQTPSSSSAAKSTSSVPARYENGSTALVDHSSTSQIHERSNLDSSARVVDAESRSSFVVETASPRRAATATQQLDTPSKRLLYHADAPETPTRIKKQKRSNVNSPTKVSDEVEGATLLLDLKTEQAIIFDQVQTYIEDIFENEDDMEEDTSERSGIPDIKTQLFDSTKVEKCLTLSTTKRLLSLVRKSAQLNSMTSIDKDHLVRLQRILLRPIGTFDVTSLPAIEQLCEQDQQSKSDWSTKIDDISNSLYSSLCISYVLSAATDIKEVYAEETLMSIVDNVKTIVEDLLLRWFAECCQSRLSMPVECKRVIDSLLQTVNTQLARLSALFAVLPITESIASRMVFLDTTIIFAEIPNKADLPCSQLLVESLKMSAVLNLQVLYATIHSQRQFLLDEVLSSLSKLPLTRQGTRQFKLPTGKSIQLVTALLLYLVQSSALISSLSDDPESNTSGDVSMPDDEGQKTRKPENADKDNTDLTESLEPILRPYAHQVAAANQTARYIINFLLERSMKSIKSMSTEEAPFKGLVDGFVEDFVAVLPFPEWPAAEVMLRWIADSMLKLVDNPKQGAQVKVSAVDTLCNIACKIKATTMTILLSPPVEGETVQSSLSQLPKFKIPSSTSASQLLGLQEMQQLILAYLASRLTVDSTIRASLEFSIANWIMILSKRLSDPTVQNTSFCVELQKSLQHFVEIHKLKNDALWSTDHAPSPADSVVSTVYLHRLSFSGFLQMFDAILPRLLIMMDHSQTTLRTKTLRSFGRLSEIDSSILSMRQVQTQLALRVSDSSPQVRDVAVDLLGKYISANPHAGADYYRVLRERIVDTGLGVRKRVMKLCKDLYCNNENLTMRADIAIQLLYRLNDEEDSAQDLAYKTFESLWFTVSFSGESSEVLLSTLNSRERQEISARAAVFRMLAADKNDSIVDLLVFLLTNTLDKAMDNRSHFQLILRLFAQVFLDGVTSSAEDEQRLQNIIALKVLAQGSPSTLSGSQMESLLPYLQYGPSVFEQNAPFYVASTYRSVIPSLSSQNVKFLGETQSTILAQLTKLPLKSLTEIVPTLCTVVQIAGDLSRVSKTLKSCLERLKSLTTNSNASDTRDKQIVLLLHLIGLFGRYLKIENSDLMRDCFAVSSHSELVNLLTSTILPLLGDIKVLASSLVARAALQNLGNICINSPDVFQQPPVLKLTDAIMNSTQFEGKRILLGVYTEYLRTEQRATDRLTKLGNKDSAPGAPRGNKTKRRKAEQGAVDVGILTGNTDKFATDGISPSLMQRYLKQILAASLGLDAQLAVIATNLIRGIVGQGLANPRNCMPTIIALETSHDPYLRGVAADIHRNLNEKHESLIESCYIDGVKLAYRYQMRMNGNILKLLPEISSIHTLYDIARNSRRGRQKFLMALAKGLDTNLDKLESLMETDVKYAHFVAHNIACLRYATNEEVHIVIHAIDKIMSTTGAALQQTLDTMTTGSDYEEEQVGKAAAILAYGMSLRNQLKNVYNISEAKCLAFEPARLGGRTDAKAAVKQSGVNLVPDWSSINAPATARQRLDCIENLFALDEHLIHQHADEPDVEMLEEGPEGNDVPFVEMTKLASAQ